MRKIKHLLEFVQWVLLYLKGGDYVIAMFLAQRIVIGKLEFKKVPQVLKAKVKEILEESGLGELATEE